MCCVLALGERILRHSHFLVRLFRSSAFSRHEKKLNVLAMRAPDYSSSSSKPLQNATPFVDFVGDSVSTRSNDRSLQSDPRCFPRLKQFPRQNTRPVHQSTSLRGVERQKRIQTHFGTTKPPMSIHFCDRFDWFHLAQGSAVVANHPPHQRPRTGPG